MVSTYRVGSDTFTYTYNADGRITHIRQNNVLRGHYGYYADGQLRRENNLDTNKTVIYTYDNGGNITKKTEYPYTTSGTLGTATATINYTYDSTWKDKLTSYNGQSISYDAMGNPTSYRGATLTWFGRQLKSYTKDSTSVSYEYDENGLRTQKTVNGVVHDYYYVGDRLVYEKLGDEYEYFYCYDADGRLAMVERVIISSGAKGYFFTITNAQGDVIGIRSTTGAVIARYNYDAFGKLISTTDDSGNTLPSYSFAYQINVRYRGYYYDSETGLYYLQSRYYDPETGRFLNADDVNFLGATETLLSYNAFAYCENDPVMYYDYSGEGVVLIATLIGLAVGGIGGAVASYIYHGKVKISWIVGGMVVGALVGAGVGWVYTTFKGAAASWYAYKAAQFSAGASTSSASIGRMFEKWYYGYNKIGVGFQQITQRIKGVTYRFDAVKSGKIIELKNYDWSKYTSYNSITKSFVQQAKKYSQFIGKTIHREKITGIKFYFSSKPPKEIIKELKKIGVMVDWVK